MVFHQGTVTLAGFRVKPELYLSHKKVDLYAEVLE